MTFQSYSDEPLRLYRPISLRKIGRQADGVIKVRYWPPVQADWTWEWVFMQDKEARKTIRYPREERP